MLFFLSNITELEKNTFKKQVYEVKRIKLKWVKNKSTKISKSSVFCRSYGFPNNLETYGLISGLWTSSFALGAFIGPSVAGILMDYIGFPKASMFIVILHLLVVSAHIHIFMLHWAFTGMKNNLQNASKNLWKTYRN